MDAHEAWEAAFNQLELQLDRANFDTWLRGASFIGVEEDIFVIGVRNTYARDMLQHRLYRNVRRVLSDVYGQPVELRFEVRKPAPPSGSRARSGEGDMPLFQLLDQQLAQEQDDLPPLHQQIRRPLREPIPESELNPRFTFDRFVVNGSNSIAYEAARAIAANPARSYNPYLVYGGVGLGKTHLLQAIAHECQARGLHVVYIPSEAFTNDLVNAIRNKNTAMFRDKYRSADVLLVDDIQFIAGKDTTQEEFFHTFNALYTFNRQIVLASDRHPREMATLEDRLRSRFEGGLVTDIQPPEFESRLAIVGMWAEERGMWLPPQVIRMLAEHAPNNIRELEGMFNQIVAKAHQDINSVTPDMAASTLQRYHQPRQHGRHVTLTQVVEVVARHYYVSLRDLCGKKRTGRINQARQVAMYLARELTDSSLNQIGDMFGGRSHTTVLHGCNKVMEELDGDPGLRAMIERIQDDILGR